VGGERVKGKGNGEVNIIKVLFMHYGNRIIMIV
jgi:hypothetical protein